MHDEGGIKMNVMKTVKIFIVIALAAGFAGCMAVPFTLKEVKDYVITQEQSYSYPLRKVMLAAGSALMQLNFKLTRMEIPGGRGMMAATCGDTRVYLKFDAITPHLTRMQSKITEKEGMRYFSGEKELFSHIRNLLDQGRLHGLNTLTAGMVPVYLSPETSSAVIAYIAPGEELMVPDVAGQWKSVTLETGAAGYIQASRLAAAKEKEKERESHENH